MSEKAKSATGPMTGLATSNRDRIIVRDKDLMKDLIGKLTFTEMAIFLILGRSPTAAETTIVDAVMVTLMEHGMTPAALATRFVNFSAPEAMQGAVAAGLLAVGSNLVGTMEGMARNLQEIVADPAGIEAASRRIARTHREAGLAVPGFGHPIHRPDDPRSPRLIEVAQQAGVKGTYISALNVLAREVDAAYGRHLTINATGAIGAVLSEIGVPWTLMRGFAIISRAAGLVAHIHEERQKPAAPTLWHLCEEAVPYAGTVQLPKDR
ncbi:MAG: citryl-CoA lyase [Alphaproteobacteria bacterium]